MLIRAGQRFINTDNAAEIEVFEPGRAMPSSIAGLKHDAAEPGVLIVTTARSGGGEPYSGTWARPYEIRLTGDEAREFLDGISRVPGAQRIGSIRGMLGPGGAPGGAKEGGA